MANLMTRWGRNFDKDNPLPAYPRPQFRREQWLNLNGAWDYEIRKQNQSFGGWQGKIIVPYSPEAQLSGVGKTLQPDEILCYRRTFTPPEGFLRQVTFLHFGAVDHACTVWINHTLAGSHVGGFTPFTLDISALVRHGENEIRLEVTDPTDTSWISRGKQSRKPGGIWYSAQSGIWQTVWLESLPAQHLGTLRMEPDIDTQTLRITASSTCTAVFLGQTYPLPAGETTALPIPNMRLWSPEDPYLYDISFQLGEDRAESYFGMRKFSLGKDDKGFPRLLLNNKPYFQHGLLDQGYWPDGLLTPPSDDALLYDIRKCKELGFNMLRKHIKMEPLRWYYHCDREGMLVWQDMINGGTTYNFPVIGALPFLGVKLSDGEKNYHRFGRADAEGRAQYYEELGCMMDHLQNCVSLCMWVPFNEGWGQFDALRAVEFIRQRDTSRTIDHASGWHDQGGGDCFGPHTYFTPLRMPKRRKDDRRAIVLSEFGGYSHAIEEHVWRPGKVFGYRIYKTLPKLRAAYERLYQRSLRAMIDQGLSASVYTQVSDVEDEVNGLMTYDREICKVDKVVF